MMTLQLQRSLLAIFGATLSACGGGGGTPVSFIPPPPTTPSSPPAPTTAANYMIAANTGGQTFATSGGFVSYDPRTGKSISWNIADGELSMGIRYNASTKQYELKLPASSNWEGLYLDPNQVPNTRDFRTSSSGGPTHLQLQEYAGTGYNFSALAFWTVPGQEAGISGGVAFGLPTPAGAVPITGTATYNGSISGSATQSSFDGLAGSYWPAIVEGKIDLSFNFEAATLSGSLSPTVYDTERRALAPLSFSNTVFAKGSTTFSGSFDTNLVGTSAFSGQFTGPQARELMGNFAFPYSWDGKTYQATGAFVAKQ